MSFINILKNPRRTPSYKKMWENVCTLYQQWWHDQHQQWIHHTSSHGAERLRAGEADLVVLTSISTGLLRIQAGKAVSSIISTTYVTEGSVRRNHGLLWSRFTSRLQNQHVMSLYLTLNICVTLWCCRLWCRLTLERRRRSCARGCRTRS